MLENIVRERGHTPYLCNAFKVVDNYILGELSSGKRRNKQYKTKIYGPTFVRKQHNILWHCYICMECMEVWGVSGFLVFWFSGYHTI